MLCVASAPEAAVRRVVLLQSLERGNLVLDHFTATLRTQLAERSTEPLTFTEFVINPFGFSDASEQEMVEYLRSTFDGRPAPDLVITTGGPAAVFARKFRSELFPDSPMLYGAVDRLFVSGNFSDHETALAVANDPIGVVGDILQLFPATENVFVVIGAGPLGRFWRSEFERALGEFRDRVRFIWPDGLSYAALLQRASTLPPRSAIFFSSFDVDADGAAYSTAQVLADLSRRANAPLFGSQSAELGHGPLGGNLISIDTLSNKTADVAAQILGGTLPGRISIPIQQPGPYVFDWRELQRWGVDEGRLPAGSLIQFREPTLWERSKWVILGGVFVFAAQSVLMTALLVSRVKRRRAELSLRESERRFRVLANSAPVMIRTSGPDARATDFNVPWLQFTGRQRDAELGTGWLEGVHRDDLEAGVDTRRRAFERREPYRLEYRLRRADGEYRWLLETVQPRFTPDGVFAGMIGSAVDITDLKAARAALSNLNRRLMEAQEQERSRLARELHDDVCQQLTMLALDLDRFSESLPEGATDAREQAREMYEQVRALGANVNGLSHRLHSAKLELFGLAAAAEAFCKELASHHGVAVECTHQNVPDTLPDGVALNLFRVLQEALSNAVKHSGARRYQVSLRGTKDDLQLEVLDEGHGFEMAAALKTPGLGLISMQERLRLVNGTVTIDSQPGTGTRVRAVVPLRSNVTPRPADLGARHAEGIGEDVPWLAADRSRHV